MSMKETIRTYKQRLIQTNSRNSSYFVSRLNDSRLIDLNSLVNEFGNKEDLQTQLITMKGIQLNEKKFDSSALNKLLLSQHDRYRLEVKEIVPFFTKKDFNNLELIFKENDLTIEEKEIIVGKLIDQYDKKSNRRFKAISKLIKNRNSVIRDYGKDDMYLGYPFIVGKFDSGKMFRAPIVLHRVKVSVNRSNITIQIVDGESIVNPVFLTAFLIENKQKYRKIDWDIHSRDYISEAEKTLNDFGVKLKTKNMNLEDISSTTKKDFVASSRFLRNEFSIVSHVVIGLFPLSNRNIFNDLEDLENTPLYKKDSVGKFISKQDRDFDSEFGEKKITRPSEDEIIYITPLDWSQKNVVKESLSGDLVIEGPPGTGKSQTIVNIVVNNLVKNKRVLVVSEKVAAISVIYNRLGDLRTNALFIKNHITDKEDFFNQIKKTIGQVHANSTSINNSQIDKEIDNHFKQIERINQKEEYQDYSFNQMINIAKCKDEITSPIIVSWCEKNKDYISNIDTLNLIEVLKMILTEENLKTSIKYQNMNQISAYRIFNQEQLLLLKRLYDEKYTENQTMVIFYTHEAGIELNLKSVIKFGVQAKEYKISIESAYEKMVYAWNKRNDIIEFIHMRESRLGELIYKYPKLTKLLLEWDVYQDNKSRMKDFKRVVDISYNEGFFDRIFNKKVKFSETELEMLNIINQQQDFDAQKFVKMENSYDKLDVELGQIINQFEVASLENMISNLLSSRFFDFTGSISRDIRDFYKDANEIDANEFYRIKTLFSKDEFEILSVFRKEKFTSFEKLGYSIKSKVIDKKVIQKYFSIYNYFKDYTAKYESTNYNVGLKIDRTRNQISKKVKGNIAASFRRSSDATSKLHDLEYQSNLKRRKSVKVLARRYHTALMTLYPVWLMTPESASALLPLTKGLFDVVIFDEASQMFVERSIPSIYRANQIVIAGDSQQLKPTSVFTSRVNEEIDEIDDFDTDEDFSVQSKSLLDHGKYQFTKVRLEYHYRSDYKELIDFSSNAFYEGSLRFASKCIEDTNYPIETIEVADGRWINRKNVEEAKSVIELIEQILSTRENDETIGVITFNANQKDFIEDLLYDCDSNLIHKELDRFNEETKEYENLFVKNIENVQGDERDIIIFSIGYAKNENGRVLNNFGTLNQESGENRLNVAITRAKKKIYIVKSIDSSELNVNVNNNGPRLFKKYLQYVEYLNSDQQEMVDTLLNQLNDTGASLRKETRFDSVFEEEVYDKIKDRINDKRYEVHSQIPVGSFSIDLGIYDTSLNQYILGIECDGAAFHSSEDAVERDYYRQIYLEQRGWNIHRIWSTNWWSTQELELVQFDVALKGVINDFVDYSIQKEQEKLFFSIVKILKTYSKHFVNNGNSIVFKLGNEDITLHKTGIMMSSYNDVRSLEILKSEVLSYYKKSEIQNMEAKTDKEKTILVSSNKFDKVLSKNIVNSNFIKCICGYEFDETIGECPKCMTNTITIYRNQSKNVAEK